MSPCPGGSILITSAPRSASIVAAAGPAMKLAVSRTFSPAKTESVAIVITSHEGAEAGCRAPDDERLHLARALVGVQRLGVGEEPDDVVVEHDAVAAEQLARPGDGLPAAGGHVALGQRGLVVAQLVGLLQLGDPYGHAEAGGDVAEHPGQQVLD